MTVYTRLTPLLRTGLALLLFMPAASLAAEADVEQSVWFWNLVIVLLNTKIW